MKRRINPEVQWRERGNDAAQYDHLPSPGARRRKGIGALVVSNDGNAVLGLIAVRGLGHGLASVGDHYRS